MTTDTKIKVQGIRATEAGGTEVFKYTDYELSAPGPGEAKVKLHAAGLNFIDIYQRRGRYPVQYPWTPGLEGAGIVEEVGSDVTVVKPGDRVAYTGCPGAYSHVTVLQADKLIPLPSDLSFEQGAAFPLQGLTAHYLVHEFYKIKKGDAVLIHAAAGGMGLLLVQWCKHFGAYVIGTVSSNEKAKVAKEAGADETIIYTEQDFVAETKRLTKDKGAIYIIDGVGKDTFTKNLDAVARRGHITIFGAASGEADPVKPNFLQGKSISLYGGSLFNFMDTREELLMRANGVLQGIKEGWLKLKIDHVLSLKDAAKAQDLLENRKTMGKVVLKCSD